MSYYSPPKRREPMGARATRRAPFYGASKAKALGRSKKLCEGCGAGNVPLDPDHVFGRAGTGARLGWPWCDMPELIAMICRRCHDAKTDYGGPIAMLQDRAIRRFVTRGWAEGGS